MTKAENDMGCAQIKPDITLMKLGAVIALHRHNLGFSQLELANRAFIHRTYLSNIERGEQNISLQTLIRIAQSLNLSTADLIKLAE